MALPAHPPPQPCLSALSLSPDVGSGSFRISPLSGPGPAWPHTVFPSVALPASKVLPQVTHRPHPSKFLVPRMAGVSQDLSMGRHMLGLHV